MDRPIDVGRSSRDRINRAEEDAPARATPPMNNYPRVRYFRGDDRLPRRGGGYLRGTNFDNVIPGDEAVQPLSYSEELGANMPGGRKLLVSSPPAQSPRSARMSDSNFNVECDGSFTHVSGRCGVSRIIHFASNLGVAGRLRKKNCLGTLLSLRRLAWAVRGNELRAFTAEATGATLCAIANMSEWLKRQLW